MSSAKNVFMLLNCKFIRSFSTTRISLDKLRVAVIGQSTFASEVYKLLRKDGHKVVGVFTIPNQGSREDPLASAAAADGTRVFKIKAWRKKGQFIPEVLEQYKTIEADLNVLPFCTQFIPMEVINFPKFQSICYHPSLLPKRRGVNAINWTLIEGDDKAGFSIFWADDGLDTGPILLQKECEIHENDNVDSLYNRFLYPEGIKSMADAVNMVADGSAPRIPQPEEGASFEPALNKKEMQKIDWDQEAQRLHNFIRGLDSSPGAWTTLDGKEVRLYGSRLWTEPTPEGRIVYVDEGAQKKQAMVHQDGLLLWGADGKMVNIQRLVVDGRMITASRYGLEEEESVQVVQLTDEEERLADVLREIWKGILSIEIDHQTDFFQSGAGSMDVVRLIEEVKDKLNITLQNEDVFMSTTFRAFVQTAIQKSRTGDAARAVPTFQTIRMQSNNMDISFPNQLFINGSFVDSESKATLASINPYDESLICQVACASAVDVDRAVKAAKLAFEEGEWGKMNPRDRGYLMYRLADLMDEHKEELATIESLDSGAVYTLALKTHVGMSIETWRYFAGWADKIHGSTIPINHARPNRNLSFTKKEPIGVCGLITPWNYPLMMLSWKMAPCLAAGNTVVIKPAQVSPLSALKFAELSAKAGFPPGVINVLAGKGSVTGEAIANHAHVRKLGFTGSTEVGQVIMRSCADSNLKKVSLELGGKSPLLIFNDCDLDKAVRMGMSGVFFNKGENCIAAGRLFVEETVHDEFVKRVVEEVGKMVIGDPLNRSTHHGPQNHKTHLDKLLEFCHKGVQEGARLVCGGRRVERKGFFMEPTVFTDVEDDMYIANEESFGPIMIVSKFNNGDLERVIQRANNTEYGLASGVFTRDVNKALYVAEKLQAGTVFVNTYNKTDVAAPFGGFKRSGFGKDLGEEALHEYLKVKCVTVEY